MPSGPKISTEKKEKNNNPPYNTSYVAPPTKHKPPSTNHVLQNSVIRASCLVMWWRDVYQRVRGMAFTHHCIRR